MIAINKDEAMEVRKRCPNAHIRRTMRQKSKRHHYFVEETREVMAVIRAKRGIKETRPRQNNNKRRGGNNGFRKTNRRNTP